MIIHHPVQSPGRCQHSAPPQATDPAPPLRTTTARGSGPAHGVGDLVRGSQGPPGAAPGLTRAAQGLPGWAQRADGQGLGADQAQGVRGHVMFSP